MGDLTRFAIAANNWRWLMWVPNYFKKFRGDHKRWSVGCKSKVFGQTSCLLAVAVVVVLSSTASAQDFSLNKGFLDNNHAPQGLGSFEEDYQLKLLGKFIFFDKISSPATMSCSTCHDPRTGGTGANSPVNATQVVIGGANPHTVGSLRPPTNTYASLIPPFKNLGRRNCGGITGYCGGNFWNGRAVGFGGDLQASSVVVIEPFILGGNSDYEKYLGPTADQALNPFPNPDEQNISIEEVCLHIENEKYSILYEFAWGEPIDCSPAGLDESYQRVGVSLSAYQSSSDINSFSSKRDFALQRELAGIDFDDSPGQFPLVGLTDQENYGHDLFYGLLSELNPEGKNARCTVCHLSDTGNPDGTGLSERYTDDAYHNIGTPKNYALTNPEPLGVEGLAGHIGNPLNVGERKAPTLRNVDKRPYKTFVKAYAANGWFKSLESLMHFYNTSAVDGETATSFGITRCPIEITTEKEALQLNCWPAPEFPDTVVPTRFVGNLGLTAEDEAAVVAYMKTFTDKYTARRPELHNLFYAIFMQQMLEHQE